MNKHQSESPTTDQPMAKIVLDELLRGIIAGDYRPGQRLVAAKLCSKLELSLAPVREALHVLAGEGIVELHRNRGAVLREMSKQDVLDLCPIVATAAGASIEIAASRIHLGNNRAIVRAEMAKVRENIHLTSAFEFYLKTNQYHYALNAMTGNPFIESMVNRHLITYWEVFLAQNLPLLDFKKDYITNYERLTEAILVGDVRSAVSIWNYHVNWTIAILKGEAITPGAPWVRE